MKTEQQNLYTIQETADKFDVHYLQVYRAIIAGVTQPLKSKRSRLLTDDNLNDLRKHFEEKSSKKLSNLN